MTALAVTDCRPDRLVTADLARVLVAVFGSSANFYLLISVLPLLLVRAGWSSAGAGLAVGVMMAATVATEVVVPVLVARFGYRAVLGAGLVLLGLPSPALLFTTSVPVVLLVSVLRGAGLAIMFVGDTALLAAVVPARRRGEALGLTGAVSGVPAVFGLPLGVGLAHRYGFGPVLLVSVVVALAGLAAIPGLPRVVGSGVARAERPVEVLRGLRATGLRRPVVVFAAITMAAGVIATFLPLAASASLAPAALFVQAAGAPVARWLAGRYGDRHGHGRLLLPSVLLTILGAASLVLLDNPVLVVAGMVAFGLGFGAAQNVSLSLMFGRVGDDGYGRVSALWSVAYDAGWGIGAVMFGLVAGGTGYALAFGIVTLGLVVALVPAYRDR